eukprot:NODE_5621_length_689_cov_29.320312_g4749_i0.p1 GENE.NODE_5621_length_689_cov_29.320312_g4749_i0~~NODE_5621_length_689_cov_29.320312_g4749_i0.p1  ORF type:complete len:77 (+),score=3.62 NODE_5621_length_689_cov_29.320312_g4749_i0:189-419(+)
MAYGAPFCDRPLLGLVTKGRAVGPSCRRGPGEVQHTGLLAGISRGLRYALSRQDTPQVPVWMQTARGRLEGLQTRV